MHEDTGKTFDQASSAPPEMVGTSLGRYHILEQPGEGGMAVVYKALDTSLQRLVAIKMILPGRQFSPQMLKRFEREARTLAQLSHPNIVKILDYGEYNGTPFLVMEYLSGGTLKKVLEEHKGKPYDWREAAKLLGPISSALAVAHQQNIIHRDVKPSNILLTEHGQPMLTDFGIAKVLDNEETADLTGGGVGIGTPKYMAPEQGMGQADARSDIYALGTVYYEMVTGRPPYQADTPMAIMLKKSTEPLPRPKKFNPELPDQIENILIKALARQPQNRYADMRTFGLALETIAATSSGTHKPGHDFPFKLLAYIGLGLFGLVFCATAVFFSVSAIGGILSAPVSGGPSPQTGELPAGAAESNPTNTPPPTPAQVEVVTPTSSPSTWKQGKIVFGLFSANRTAIHIQDLAAGTEPQLVLPASNVTYEAPVFSPDGLQIAFYVYRTDVRLVNAAPNSNARILKSNCTEPTWSPDGSKILCRDVSSGNFQVIDSQSGAVLQQTNVAGAIPQWSPSGDEFVFARFGDGRSTSLWYFSLAEQRPIKLVERDFQNYAPAWSPDGNWIAFQSGPQSDFCQIWVMDKFGNNLRQITNFATRNRAPVWSPDGKWIGFVSDQVFVSGNGGYGEFFAVSLETGEVVQVTDTGSKIYEWRVSWVD
jgi:serine/threonine protein kinase